MTSTTQQNNERTPLLKDPSVRLGIRHSAPLFAPAIPFGFLLGAAMSNSELPTWVAWLSSITIFGGAAQLALVTTAGLASWWTAVATAVVINSRHIMYSAALTPRYQNQPRWFRWIGPYFVIDQVFALTSVRTELNQDEFRRYSMTCGIFFGSCWLAVTTLGVFLGTEVPASWRLEMAIAIMFAGLISMPLAKPSGVVAAIVGGGSTLLLLDLPNQLGLLVGAVLGMVAAFLTEEILDSGKASSDSPSNPSNDPPNENPPNENPPNENPSDGNPSDQDPAKDIQPGQRSPASTPTSGNAVIGEASS